MSAVELPKRAAIYARISQDRSEERLGVDRQESACRELAERNGWEVVGVYADDNISAFSGRTRPEFDRLLADIQGDEIDVVVAWHVDRLYRGFGDLGRLTEVIKKCDVTVHTVMAGSVDLSTASGQLMAEVMTSIAKHESMQKGERIKAKHAQSAVMGLAHGGTRPFGYRRVPDKPGMLEVVEAEAEVILEAARRVLAGESVRSIALNFQRRGMPTVRGGPWRPKALADILRSPRIAGIRPSGGSAIGPAQWTEIIDDATWRRLVAVLTNPPRGRLPRSYLLAGFLFCGRCGHRLFSVTGIDKGKTRRRYHCRPEEPSACGRLSTDAAPLEAYLTGLLFGAAQGADLGQVRRSRRDGDQVKLATQLEQDEQLLNDLANDFGARLISRGEWLAARVPIDERMADARKGLARFAPDDPLPADIADVEGRWDSLTFDQRRAVIALFINRAYIDPAKQRGGRFDPARVRIEWAA